MYVFVTASDGCEANKGDTAAQPLSYFGLGSGNLYGKHMVKFLFSVLAGYKPEFLINMPLFRACFLMCVSRRDGLRTEL